MLPGTYTGKGAVYPILGMEGRCLEYLDREERIVLVSLDRSNSVNALSIHGCTSLEQHSCVVQQWFPSAGLSSSTACTSLISLVTLFQGSVCGTNRFQRVAARTVNLAAAFLQCLRTTAVLICTKKTSPFYPTHYAHEEMCMHQT